MESYISRRRKILLVEGDYEDSFEGDDEPGGKEEADSKEEEDAFDDDQREEDLITVSHFLPLQALCPEKRFLLTPELTKVVGSDALAHQVRSTEKNDAVTSDDDTNEI